MCKHCGSTEDFWWSRAEPMGYYCSDCGAADESTTYPYVEVQGNIIAELSSRNDWLNKELAAVIEQRDRLAEAMRQIASGDPNWRDCLSIAREALAAVEGGSDE